MRFKAKVATRHVSVNGFEYTDEVLDKMAKMSSGISIAVDFDDRSIVGVVTSSMDTEDGLYIEGDLFDNSDLDKYRDYFCVPGVELDSDTKEFLRPFLYGLTKRPVEHGLTKIEVLDG